MVMLWQVETGNLFKKMKGHAQSVYQVAFSPDGKTLASGGYDKTVFMWQVADGTLLDTTLGHSSADTLAFSPNGVFLVLGDESSVDMCQLSNKACTSLWNKSYLYAKNLAFLSNNKLIVKSDGLNNVTILELSGETAGKKPITAVVTTTETITTTEVMTATTEVMEPTNETKAANKVFLTTEVTQYDSGRSKISFSPHGTTFATTINNVIQLWSIPEGQLGRSMSLPNDYNINELQFSPDGKILASTSYVDPTNDPYTIHLWQVSDGTLLHHWQAFEKESFGKLLFSPDSSILATDRSQTVKLWNISDGTLRHTFEYDDSIYDMFFLNNETFVIHTSGKEQLLHFLDITNNTLLNNSSPFEGNYVKFSPDKTLFVTTKKDDEKNSDHTINVWNRDGSRRYTVEEKIYRSYNVIFSPDGTMLATINWDIKLWQASSGILLSSIDNNSLYLAYNGGGATFSPDGHLFTIFNAEIIYLWKVVGSKLVEVEQIHQPGGVYGEMTFTPDSSKLVVSGNDHTVWIWDVSSLH